MADIIVRVVRSPGTVTEVALSAGSTVSNALSIAGLTPASNEALTVNGDPAEMSTVLSDGDRVILAKSAKSA